MVIFDTVLCLVGSLGLFLYGMKLMGANIGTTVDALLASIGTRTAARRAALTHLLSTSSARSGYSPCSPLSWRWSN